MFGYNRFHLKRREFMKKLALSISILIVYILSTCFILINTKSNTVLAINEQYGRIITSDTPLYQNANTNEFLCYLPYTYYVKILGELNNYYHVECYGENQMAIDGYIPKSYLFFDDLVVINPYVSVTVTTLNTCQLYLDKELKQGIQYVFKDRQLRFYGFAISELGDNLIFVEYNGNLGYVKESYVTPFTIENHSNPLTFLTPETPDSPQDQVQSQTQVDLRIIIIGSLVLAGLISIVVIFKNKPEKKMFSNEYYEEGDFE